MKKEGLYLPNYFKYQNYNNLFQIPITETKKGTFFVPIEYFRNVYLNKNRRIFDNITKEFVLRGGKFYLEKESPLFPKVEYQEIEEIILVDDILADDAYEKIDYDLLDIRVAKKYFQIDNNNFFHYLPLNGFKVLNMSSNTMKLFRNELLKHNFKIHEYDLSKKEINSVDKKLVNKRTSYYKNTKNKIAIVEKLIKESSNLFFKNIDISDLGLNNKLVLFFEASGIKKVFQISKVDAKDLNTALSFKSLREILVCIQELPLNYELIALKVEKFINKNNLEDIEISAMLSDSFFRSFNERFKENDLSYLGELKSIKLIKVFKSSGIGRGKINRFLNELAVMIEKSDRASIGSPYKGQVATKEAIYFAFLLLQDVKLREDVTSRKLSFISKKSLDDLVNERYSKSRYKENITTRILEEIENINSFQINQSIVQRIGSFSIKSALSVLDLDYVYDDLLGFDSIRSEDLLEPVTQLLLDYDELEIQIKQIIYLMAQSILNIENFLELNKVFYTEKLDLDDREQEIFVRRIVLEKQDILEELGKEFGVSRERIRQIESNLKKRIITFFELNNIELYLLYLEKTDQFILNHKQAKHLMSRVDLPGIYYDENLDLILLDSFNERISDIYDEINELLDENNIIEYSKFKEFVNTLDSVVDSQLISLVFERISVILEDKKFMKTNNYLVKKSITKNEIYGYIVQTFYKDKILEFDTEKGFRDFLNYLSLLGQEKMVTGLLNNDRDSSIRSIESALEINNSYVLKLGTHKYRALDMNKVPYELVNNMDQFIEQEIMKYDFVSAKKIYRNFRNEIKALNYNEQAIYYLLKILLDNRYEFSGRSSTFRIYEKGASSISTPEIILKTLEDNNGEMHLDDLVEQIGVERYSIEHYSEESRVAISNNIVRLIDHTYRLSEQSEAYILELYNNLMDSKGYVPIKEIYNQLRFQGEINKELMSIECDTVSEFRHLLKAITPDSEGHTKILFRAGQPVDYFDIFMNELSGVQEYYRTDLEEAGLDLGLANSTIHLYIKQFINKGQLIPVYIDQYLHQDMFSIDAVSLQKVDEFIVEQMGDCDYLSLSTVGSYLGKLPKIEYSWSIQLLNYLAVHKLSYKKVNIGRVNYRRDPLLIVRPDADLSYSDIVRKELSKFDEVKTDVRVLEFLKRRGLVDSEARTLYDIFFTKGLLTKNEFNRIEIIGE